MIRQYFANLPALHSMTLHGKDARSFSSFHAGVDGTAECGDRVGWNGCVHGVPLMHLLDVVPYVEPLFAAVVADSLQLALIEPQHSRITELPFDLRESLSKVSLWGVVRMLDGTASRFSQSSLRSC